MKYDKTKHVIGKRFETIKNKVEIIKGRKMNDRQTKVDYFDTSIKNISNNIILFPIKVIICNITIPTITVTNADGFTDDGNPYFLYFNNNNNLLNNEISEIKV